LARIIENPSRDSSRDGETSPVVLCSIWCGNNFHCGYGVTEPHSVIRSLLSLSIALTLNSTTGLFFTALCGSWFLLARNIWRILFVGARRPWLDAAEVASGSVAICCIFVDLLDSSRVKFFGTQLMLANLGCLIFVISLGSILIKLLSQTKKTNTASYRMATWSLALFAITIGAWSFWRLQDRSSNFNSFGIGEVSPGIVVSENEFYALTDLGEKIDLFNFSVESQLFEEYSKDFDVRFPTFTSTLIHRGEADSSSNCHGWVFTGGRFLLRGVGVERILQGNGYSVVSTPSAGDIVIYRNESGNILHTGLVQGVLNEGTVIIESKWGTDQRFLHLPEDQPYSTSFAYYRSDRTGHLIDVRKSSGLDIQDD
jgi:hypothetical protein